jgi:tRNA dimethylallyltransferase
MDKGKILILGVTASGKSQLAFDLAGQTGAEIISVDSMKVYRRMDIGTAKPPITARQQVRYHLIDIAEPSESFSVARFLDLAGDALENIQSQNKPVIAVGGTAMYIKALLYGLFEGPGGDQKRRAELRSRAETEGLEKLHQQLAEIDPAAAQRIHPNDGRRIIRALEVYQITGRPISSFQNQFDAENLPEDWFVIGLRREKEAESKRINARAKKMIEAGLIEEVKSLLAEAQPLSQQARCAIGYAEIIEHLSGRLTLDEAVEQIKKNTRRFAKSQRTWFKTFRNVNWLDINPQQSSEDILADAKALLKKRKRQI